MCGRIVQKSGPMDYMETLWPNLHRILTDSAGPQYNVSPGTKPLTLHRLTGTEDISRLPWGYKRSDSKHFMINAKLETILKNGWPWRFFVGTGRILVPVDGWYEWAAPTETNTQPYYIHDNANRPLMLAALTAWQPAAAFDAAHGFAIVTDDAKGGMLDIHDRRPVILSPDLAREWVNPETSVERAREILSAGMAEAALTWYAVKAEVGNSKYQMPDAIDPLAPTND